MSTAVTGANPAGAEPTVTKARYDLIYDDIRARIGSGEYRPDTRLPGERELSGVYGVSRETVRQALAKAEQHGLLIKAPGRGTFVARPWVLQDVAEASTFRSSVEAAAMKPSYAVRAMRRLPASAELALRLGVATGATILDVDLLGLANGRPLAAYRVSLSPLVAASVEAALADHGDRATYELAAVALSVRQLEVEQTFEAISVDDEMAALLQVPSGSSAFRTSSLYTTSGGRPVEWRVATYPGARYTFRAHRRIQL